MSFSAKITTPTSTLLDVKPLGLNSLVMGIDYDSSLGNFYRKKLTGDLEFVRADYDNIKYNQDSCCSDMPLLLYRDCDTTNPFLKAVIPSRKIDWNNEMCEAKTTPEIRDLYYYTFRYQQTKINVLNMPTTVTLTHLSRLVFPVNTNQNTNLVQTDLALGKQMIQDRGGRIVLETWYSDTEKQVTFEVDNNRGRRLVDIILYIIQLTYTGTEAASIIPESVEAMSKFFTDETNVCTNRSNIAKNAVIFQASDILEPLSSTNATGRLLNGTNNQDLCLTFKEMMDNLKAVFDVDWWIDGYTGKFRIEHSSYFEKGGDYSDNQIGLDLTQAKYAKYFANYKYSFKYDLQDIVEIEELKFSLNDSINQGSNAVLYISSFIDDGFSNNYYIDQTTYNAAKGFYPYGYLKIDDFSLGNIHYMTDCNQRSDQGEIVRKTTSCDIFITHFEAVEYADTSIDKTKWVLVEVEPRTDDPSKNQVVWGNVIRQATIPRTVKNGNFAATCLMRDFHTYGKCFPVAYMAFDEFAPKNTQLYIGYVRYMNSLRKSKLFYKFMVPFCCTDEDFDPSKLIKLPNGILTKLKTGSYSFGTETLELEVLGDSPCALTANPITSGECPSAGTLLLTETYQKNCFDLSTIMNSGGSGVLTTITRNWYADGVCGRYFVDSPECFSF